MQILSAMLFQHLQDENINSMDRLLSVCLGFGLDLSLPFRRGLGHDASTTDPFNRNLNLLARLHRVRELCSDCSVAYSMVIYDGVVIGYSCHWMLVQVQVLWADSEQTSQRLQIRFYDSISASSREKALGLVKQ